MKVLCACMWKYIMCVYVKLYDTCVGGSKLERKVYHAFLIRLFVNHSYDNQQ